MRHAFAALIMLLFVVSLPTRAQQTGATLDETLAPGANFDKAEFRFWRPTGDQRLQGLVVLVPGSNGDGRPMADDPFWQDFATRHQLGLVACRFTDKPQLMSGRKILPEGIVIGVTGFNRGRDHGMSFDGLLVVLGCWLTTTTEPVASNWSKTARRR